MVVFLLYYCYYIINILIYFVIVELKYASKFLLISKFVILSTDLYQWQGKAHHCGTRR